jgi:flagellar basal-body rod protein FlgF
MIKGLYSAVSAMVANVNRQQTLSHNVSNLDTPGFKQILSSLKDFTSTEVIYPPGSTSQQTPLTDIGVLGLGVDNAPDMNDFTQGGLQFTGNTLDVAVEGNGFFTIKTADGERYTRDGRFLRDADGQLVTVDGFKVLDDGGQPIKLDMGETYISSAGEITVDGKKAATLGLAVFKDPATELTRDGSNTFSAQGKPAGETPGRVVQQYLEMSNANPTQLMTQLVEVSRSYEAAQQLVQNQDELLGKAISTLGRLG